MSEFKFVTEKGWDVKSRKKEVPDYDTGMSKDESLMEIAYQLKRIADNLDRNYQEN